MQQKNRWYGKGIITAFKTLRYLEDEPPEVRERLIILDIYEVKGLEYVKNMFGIGRSIIYVWKKKLKEEGIMGLRNKSRAPIHTRESKVTEETKEYIREYRIKHEGVGKPIVHAQLKKYCERKGIKCVSENTVGRIIKELKDKVEIDNQKELRIKW